MVKENKTQRLLVLGWICSHMCLRTKDGSLFTDSNSVIRVSESEGDMSRTGQRTVSDKQKGDMSNGECRPSLDGD
ncbi:hypothetical protein YC2023_017429 [Brassica napus]